MATALVNPIVPSFVRPTAKQRSAELLLASLDPIAANSRHFLSRSFGHFESAGQSDSLPRGVFLGPPGGGDPIRIGLLAGIHGDEPEGVYALVQFLILLNARPELAAGYCLCAYPVCSPTGFEDHTRHSRRGRDLNREFWNNSREPEVLLLQEELLSTSTES